MVFSSRPISCSRKSSLRPREAAGILAGLSSRASSRARWVVQPGQLLADVQAIGQQRRLLGQPAPDPGDRRGGSAARRSTRRSCGPLGQRGRWPRAARRQLDQLGRPGPQLGRQRLALGGRGWRSGPQGLAQRRLHGRRSPSSASPPAIPLEAHEGGHRGQADRRLDLQLRAQALQRPVSGAQRAPAAGRPAPARAEPRSGSSLLAPTPAPSRAPPRPGPPA